MLRRLALDVDIRGMYQSDAELWATIIRSFAFVVFYTIVGFGPGFIAGILLANRLFGKGQPTYMELHEQNIAKAAEHNKQWDPRHERWQKT